MAQVDAAKLTTFVANIFAALGSSRDEATRIGRCLVNANLAGHDSHGVGMLPHYVRNLKAGGLHPNRAPKVVSESDSFAVWDGRNGYGQVIESVALPQPDRPR